jgi:putative membrane protein
MVLATAVATVVAEADQWSHHGWNGAGWMWLWGTVMLALWVALIAGAVWVIARRPEPRAGPPAGRAREILAERYARGEIDADEYRDRLETLR